MFWRWPDSLPPTVEVCGVELPGHGKRLREPPFARLPPLIEALAQGLRPYLDKPFAFFGHSVGALIGFELARELRRQHGPSLEHLFIAGAKAPHAPRTGDHIHDLSDTRFLAELRDLNGTPPAVLEHKRLMQILLPALRADFAVYETYAYVHEAPLACSISVFGGARDRAVSYEELRAWRDQTYASFSLQMLPGDHFFPITARSRLLSILSREAIGSDCEYAADLSDERR
jgi:medium-chain acyl-[acyl-carrier-protein] hydrolase